MTETSAKLQPGIVSFAPGANLGYSRMNWVVDRTGVPGVILYSAGRTDFLGEFSESLSRLGLKVDDLLKNLDRPSETLETGEAHLAEGATGIGVEETATAPVKTIWIWHSGDAKLTRARLKSRADLPVIAVFDYAAVLGIGAEGVDHNPLDAMVEAARAQHEMLKLLAGLDREFFIVSARKAKDFPEPLLRALADFLGITVDDVTMRQAVGYLRRELPAFPYTMRFDRPSESLFRGNVDSQLKNGILSGWVKHYTEDERVRVRILIDGEEVTREVADYRRDDLVGLGIGDGGYGYAIDLGRFLDDGKKYVEVRTVDRDILVGASEMTLKRGTRVRPDPAP